MNRLKLISGVLLILLTGMAAGHLGTVFYFNNKIYNQGPPAFHHLIKKKISHKLRLTDEQQVKFDTILAQSEKEFDAFRQKHHPEVEQILTDCFQQINDILTPEQQQRFEIIKHRFKRGFLRQKGCSSPDRLDRRCFPLPEELKELLSLNDDQVKNITPIIHSYNQETKNLVADQPRRHTHPFPAPGDKDDLHEKMTQIEVKLAESLKPYLNENQISKFQELMKNRQHRQTGQR